MPKAFTEEEFNQLNKKLLSIGKQLIIEHGYSKIGIRDITGEANISSGMFYKFYKSKDRLFFAILDREKSIVRDRILSKIKMKIACPEKALSAFYYVIIEELESNPLMHSIILNSDYNKITANMDEKTLIEEREKSLIPLKGIFMHWCNVYGYRLEDIEMVIEALRSLVYLWFHREEIGTDRYDLIIGFLIQRIVQSLEK